MMNLICPQCHQPIDSNDYNISTDIAYCRYCDAQYSLATLTSVEAVDESTYQQFTHTYCQEFGREITARVPFNAIFRIIGWVMILNALFMLGLFAFLAHGEDAQGVLIFGLVFGSVVVADLLFALFFLGGKYAISIESGLLQVRTGAFPFRARKRIEFDRTTRIYLEKNPNVRTNGQPVEIIAVETDARKIHFGTMMSQQNKACVMRWLAEQIQ